MGPGGTCGFASLAGEKDVEKGEQGVGGQGRAREGLRRKLSPSPSNSYLTPYWDLGLTI